MKISVFGTGYVGLSLSVLISRIYDVSAIDIISEKVTMINNGKSPIVDHEIESYLSSGKLKLKATTNAEECRDSDFIIVATPTNYDSNTGKFDTSSVEGVIDLCERICPSATIVIKSTVPIGYTKRISEKKKVDNVIFSPEFLREGKALYDNLYPSRIIVGYPCESSRKAANKFADLLSVCAKKENVIKKIMHSTEAESVKLFSNTYLALRVAYFNELDTFAEVNNLSTRDIIEGVCLDPRIGNCYNNPSFGYGGYCLPKDTKQLSADYVGIPNELISAIVRSNVTRKKFITSEIERKLSGKRNPTVGIYRLTMKSDSDNFRESSIIDIMRMLKKDGFNILVYEPSLKSNNFEGFPTTGDISDFKSKTDIIVANRNSSEINLENTVYTRDLFHEE